MTKEEAFYNTVFDTIETIYKERHIKTVSKELTNKILYNDYNMLVVYRVIKHD